MRTFLQHPSRMLLLAAAVLTACILIPSYPGGLWAAVGDEEKQMAANGEPDENGRISMDFTDVDIRTVIEYMSRVTGLGFVVDESVRGKVSIISPRDMMRRDEAQALLDSLLAVKGYSSSQADNVVHILPSPETQKRAAQIVANKGALRSMGDETVVTALVPLTYTEASIIRGVLAPLLPKETSLQVFAPTNSLIITDRAESAKRLLPLLEILDLKKGVGIVEKIDIVHSTAEAVTEQLNRIFKLKDVKQNTPFQQRSAEVVIYPDKRTNSILVVASPLEISKVKELVALVDVPVEDEEAILKMYTLRYIEAAELESQLKAIFSSKTPPATVSAPKTEVKRERKVIQTGPGKSKTVWVEKPVRVPGDKPKKRVDQGDVSFSSAKSMNILVVVARPTQQEMVKELVDTLDIDDLPSRHIRIIPLTYADEETVIEQVTKLCGLGSNVFKGASSMFLADSRLIPNKRLRAIMVSTPSETLMEEIESVIKRLDKEKVKGQADVNIYRLKNADATSIAETLTKLYAPKGGDDKTASRIEVVVEPSYNVLLINAPPKVFAEIETLLEQLDVLRPQVLVEALIAEVSMSKAERLGIEWGYVDSASGRMRGFGLTNFAMKNSALSSQGLSMGVIKGNVDLDKVADNDLNELSKIRALIQTHRNDSDFNIISTPSILTLDNEEASITVGEVVALPQGYLTDSNSSSDLRLTNFTYEDVGVTLNITPRITQRDFVTLKIEQIIKNRQETFLYDFNVPIINKREAKTTVTVPNRETVVIGGLIREDDQEIEDAIPGLSRLPLLGGLFKKKRKEKKKVNLLIFITPHVVFDPSELVSGHADNMPLSNNGSPTILMEEADKMVYGKAVQKLLGSNRKKSQSPRKKEKQPAPRAEVKSAISAPPPVEPEPEPKQEQVEQISPADPKQEQIEQTVPAAPKPQTVRETDDERWQRILRSDQRVRKAFEEIKNRAVGQ